MHFVWSISRYLKCFFFFVGIYLGTDPALQREVGQLIMLQRYLDSLQEKMAEKEFAVTKCR